MRMTDVRNDAWDAIPDTIPTMQVPDFAQLFCVLVEKSYLVLKLDSDDLRMMSTGAEESKTVRDFRNWCIAHRQQGLSYRRIGKHLWYVVLGSPTRKKKPANTVSTEE